MNMVNIYCDVLRYVKVKLPLYLIAHHEMKLCWSA